MIADWKKQSEELVTEITLCTEKTITSNTLEQLCTDMLAAGLSWMDVRNQLIALRATLKSKIEKVG